MNGDLPGAAGYGAGLHLVSPQMNGAAAAAAAAAAGYGRSPVVSQTVCKIICLSSVTVTCNKSAYYPVGGQKGWGGRLSFRGRAASLSLVVKSV